VPNFLNIMKHAELQVSPCTDFIFDYLFVIAPC